MLRITSCTCAPAIEELQMRDDRGDSRSTVGWLTLALMRHAMCKNWMLSTACSDETPRIDGSLELLCSRQRHDSCTRARAGIPLLNGTKTLVSRQCHCRALLLHFPSARSAACPIAQAPLCSFTALLPLKSSRSTSTFHTIQSHCTS